MAQVNTMLFGRTSGSKAGNRTDDPTTRVSVAHYTSDEVIRQFLGLYNCLDFKTELEEIGITRFQFMRRKKAMREFRALSIALWGLALQKSFPNDAGAFFAEFREKAPMLAGDGKEVMRLHARVNEYIELLSPKRDADFSPVASYLANVLALNANDQARLRLKLSLIIRNLYMLIFDKLV